MRPEITRRSLVSSQDAPQPALSPAGQGRPQPFTTLLLAGTAAWVILWFIHTLGYWEDDAWIHLEFARSLARGHGFSFNGHIVYGDTSPLWVWLLDAFHLVIPSWIAAGKTLAGVGCLFALAGIFLFAEALTRDLGRIRSRLFAAVTLLVLVVNPYFGYWAFSGMEALTASGLVCWGLLSAACDPLTAPIPPRRFILACLCAGLAPLLRPEMGFFTILLGLVLFVRWVNLPAVPRAKLTLFFGGFALVAGPGIAWALYAVRTFGSVLPTTNAAKRAAPQDSVLKHLLGIYAFGFPLVLIGLLLLLVWLTYTRKRSGPGIEALLESLPVGGWLLFVWTAVNSLFYVVDHTYVQTRYIFVTAPLLTLVLLALAFRWHPRLFLAGTVFGGALGVFVSLLATWPLITNKIGVDREYAQLASFLHSLPPNAPVAHYSIGEAAFLSEHPIIDLGGITRPGVIPFLFDPTDARLVWWMHEQGARFAVYSHSPEPGSTLVWQQDIPATGWFLDPRRYRNTERLEVWKLPAVPTIPLPADMPTCR